MTKGVVFWSGLLWTATAVAQVGSVPGPRWISPPISHGADLTGVAVQVGIGIDSSRLSPKFKALVWAMQANGDRRCTILDYTSGSAIGDVGGVVISSTGSACEVEGGDRIVLETGYSDVGTGTDSVDFYGAGSDATYIAAADNPLADLGYSGWLGIDAPLVFYPDTPSSRDEFATTHRFQKACADVTLAAGTSATECIPWNRKSDTDALGTAPAGWCAVQVTATPVTEPIRIDKPPSVNATSICAHLLNSSYSRQQTATVCCYGYRWDETP